MGFPSTLCPTDVVETNKTRMLKGYFFMNGIKTMPQGYLSQLGEVQKACQDYGYLLEGKVPNLPEEPVFLYEFSKTYPILRDVWMNGSIHHGDLHRVFSVVNVLGNLKDLGHHGRKEQSAMVCGTLRTLSTHITYLQCNHLARWNPEEPLPKHLVDQMDPDTTLLLDYICPVQEEFEHSFSSAFDYIWSHHIPVTEKRGQQILDGLEDEEEFLEKLQEYLCEEFGIDPEDYEEEEEFLEEIPCFSTYDLSPFLSALG